MTGLSMSDAIFDWYKATVKLIETAGSENDDPGIQDLINGWNEALETIETACPGLKERFERNRKMQKSFTPAQVDFICYQIGDWYIEWKDKMWTDGKPNQHRLGFAKEQLKTIICGE